MKVRPRAWPVAFTLVAAISPLAGQAVRGQVVASEDGSAVSAAFVSLVDDTGRRVDADLTTKSGFFELDAPAPGAYAVRVERIGFEDWGSEPFELATGEVRSVRYEVRLLPVRLSAIRVRVAGRDRRCLASPADEVDALRVWTEIRKALERTVWAEERRIYRFSAREWEKELGPRARPVRDTRLREADWLARTPYRSPPAEKLSERGFVEQERDGSFIYYAPDARTLLSDPFLASHCFGLRRRTEGGRRFVGLAFEPTRDRRVPEIRGILWIDEETAELDRVEFRYANLPIETAADEAGGRVEFRRLPDGGFIVHRWWIRMPLVREDYLMIRGMRGSRERHRVVGYEEEGAEVTAVYTARGHRLRMAGGAAIAGSVREGDTGRPIDAAPLALVGPTDSLLEHSDSAGGFRFEGLEAGDYLLRVSQARLSLLGAAPEEADSSALRLSLGEGEEREVRLVVPSDETLFQLACPESSRRSNVGLVAGRVRSTEDGRPVPGAEVVARWRLAHLRGGEARRPAETAPESTSAVSDVQGLFRLCSLPGGIRVTLEASAEGFRDAGLAFEQDARVVWRDLLMERIR